jgi:hypothetical protein
MKSLLIGRQRLIRCCHFRRLGLNVDGQANLRGHRTQLMPFVVAGRRRLRLTRFQYLGPVSSCSRRIAGKRNLHLGTNYSKIEGVDMG